MPSDLQRRPVVSPGGDMTGQPQAAQRDSRAGGARRGRLTREDWIELGLRLIGAGRAPVDVALAEMCAAAGATKGSFYSHFPGGVGDLHQALLARWADGLQLGRLAADVRALQSPADQLRLLLERISSAGWAPAAMQRWAAVSPVVAAVVAESADACSRLAGRALTDLGLAEKDGPLCGALLVRAALSASPLASDVRKEAEAFIAVAERSAGNPAGQLRAVRVEGLPSGLFFYQVLPGMSDDQQNDLARQVQDLMRQVGAAPAGPGSA
jgi:AcrR family transcriptional regulator